MGQGEWIPAQDALVQDPTNVAAGADGSVYYLEHAPFARIRRVTPDGRVVTFAGGVRSGFDVGPILPALDVRLDRVGTRRGAEG